GRLAPCGSSLRVERARAWQKLPSPSGVVAISPAPAIITSASPYWMSRMARPIACVEVVQAVTVAMFGPVSLKLIETWPEIMLMMLLGTKNGEIFLGLRASMYFW